MQWHMTDLNLAPKFKYSTLLCSQIWDIVIIDVPTRDIPFHKNSYPVQDLEPHDDFSEIEHNGALQTRNLHHSSNVACSSVVKSETFLVYLEQLELDQLTKMITMFRSGTPQPWFFGNWTEWCMTDLNLTPHFKYTIILCCRHRDILVYIDQLYLYQFTKMINMFRVGIPPPIFRKLKINIEIFNIFRKSQKWIKIDFDVCW